MAFSDPGDAVLLQLPSYPPFMAAINDTGRRLIANHMRDNGTHWVLDLAAYEAAPDARTRVLIFCHPQNPTGRAFNRTELEEVAAFAIRHDLTVVSDEIHADIVYPGNTHIRWRRCLRRLPRAPSPSSRRPRASTFPHCAVP
jgi:cystathionine beta-lyase